MTDFVELMATNTVEAHLLAGALRVEDIEVRTDRDGLGGVYGIDVGALGTRLYVRADQVEAARALIAELRADD